MRRSLKFFLKLSLFLIIFSLVSWFCRKQTGGFKWSKVSSSLSFNPYWQTPIPNEQECEAIFSQPFYYVNKGVQSFIFSSADGKYILKLFRQNRLTHPFWLDIIPLSYYQQKAAILQSLLFKEFDSYKIAYEELKEETGLIFLHLNKVSFLPKPVEIVDRIGIHYKVDLNQFEFLIQKQATLLYPTLQAKIEDKKFDEAKEILKQLILVLKTRFTKGIGDKDPDLNKNFGVLGTKTIQIDVGGFKKEPVYLSSSMYKQEIFHITDNLHQWLEHRYPELDKILHQEIELACTN